MAPVPGSVRVPALGLAQDQAQEWGNQNLQAYSCLLYTSSGSGADSGLGSGAGSGIGSGGGSGSGAGAGGSAEEAGAGEGVSSCGSDGEQLLVVSGIRLSDAWVLLSGLLSSEELAGAKVGSLS